MMFNFKKKRETSSNLKICTLSGTNEIGRNSSFIEYGDTILILDCGFSFPEQELYGIDYLIPNLNYLKKNKKKVKGVLITHGHLDHTGALAYVLPELDFPPVFAGKFANALIKERLTEFELKDKVKLIDVHRNSELVFGPFKVTFIGVTHSIPNSFTIFIESPKGNIFFSGDYKIDEEPANELPTDYSKLKSLRGKVDLALMESTNATEEGKSQSSMALEKSLEEIVANWKGRVIVASFASIVSRTYSLIRISQKTNRKIAFLGRSLHSSLKIAQDLRYIEIPKGLMIEDFKIKEQNPSQTMIVCTGSQGERYAALNLISLGQHRSVKIQKGDLVILSSSEIPGNIVQIQHMTDRLIKAGAEIIKDDTTFVHTTGHGMQMDMKMMFDLIQPKHVMPIHGFLTLRYMNKKNFIKWGMAEEKIYLTEDGQCWEFDGTKWIKSDLIDSKPILIDGLGIGDVGDVVIRDRQQLAEFGVLSVIINLSQKTYRLLGDVRFASRGFVYMKKSTELMKQLKQLVKDVHRDWYNKSFKSNKPDENELKENIEKALSKMIFKKTERMPVILITIV